MRPTGTVFGAFVRSGLLALALLSAPAAAQSNEIVTIAKRILILQREGRYDDAVPLAKRAVELAQATVGRRHPVYASALGMLAGLYTAQGRYAEAEPLYKRVIAINEQTLGRRHSQTGSSLASLGALYKNQGRHAEAEALFERALSIHQRADGPEHPLTGSALSLLAGLRHAQGRYAEAESLFRKSLRINEKALGRTHPVVAVGLSNLGEVARIQGRHDEAASFFQRALAINERALGPEHPTLAVTINNLAELHHIQGRYADAERLFRRVLAIEEKALGPDHATIAVSLSNLAGLYRSQGRYNEAEPLFLRALAIGEKALGHDHPTLAVILNNLALLQRAQGHDVQAEPLYRRALAVKEAALGPDHPDVAVSLNHLAEFHHAQGRHDEAEPLLRRALAIRERALGSDHYSVASILGNLALVFDARGRADEAETLYRRVLAIQRKSLGPENTASAIVLHNLGLIYRDQGRHAEADSYLRRALAIQEKAFGPDHPEVAATLDSLAGVHARQGRWRDAWRAYKQAGDILIRQAVRETETARDPENAWARKETRLERSVFSAQVRAAWRVAEQDPTRLAGLAADAYMTAQWGQRSQAAAALAQMAARFSEGEDDLARLVRQRQDLIAHRRHLDGVLIAAASKPPKERNAAQEDGWRRERVRSGRKMDELDLVLAERFPDYAALTNPEPLTVEDAQAVLRPGEALYQLVLHADEAFAWVVTQDSILWRALSRGGKAIAEDVEALRCGLDASRWTAKRGLRRDEESNETGRGLARVSARTRCRTLLGVESSGQGSLPFDLARAHALYETLFAPFEDQIRDKHLLFVPAGPLASLPIHVLVTEPAGADSGPERYAKAAWLARRQPITILPSTTSLKALRASMRPRAASKPFIGFGNPLLLGPDGDDRRAWNKKTCPNAAPVYAQRSDAPEIRGRALQFYQKGLADVDRVRLQPPLPETVDELCAVAAELGATENDLFLGDRATERRLKRLSASGALDDYRVAHFATHGLLASETESFAAARAEPALMLSPPSKATEEDDGLLTASEVARLDLAADFVVLSACNTAGAGEAAGSEALSGLARAFFYAGAQGLIVSHWYVDSEAAVKLVVELFAELGHGPRVGLTEALRRAMLARIAEGGVRAHPAYWAPFVVVGGFESASRRRN